MPDFQPEFPGDRPRSNQQRILTMIRWLLYMVFVVIAFFIVNRLAPVLNPLLAAAGSAYLLDPVVDWLEGKGVKRVWAVVLLLALFLGGIAGIVLVLVPQVTEELASFMDEMPVMVEGVVTWIGDEFGYEVPASWQAYASIEEVTTMLRDAAGPATSIAAAALGGVFGVLGRLAEILLIPVFAFYFLVDWDEMVARLRAMIPPRHRGPVVSVIIDINTVVSSWIRGQFTVITLLAVLYAVCFYFLGVRLAVSVGLLVGLLTIIPFIGTVVGAAMTLILVILDWQGPGQLVAVVAVFVILHLLEAAVLTPKIVGKRVGLGESGALFAVLAGGKLLGFTGVILAVPLAASIAVLVRRGVEVYEQSEFFGADDFDHSVPLPTSEVAGAPPEAAADIASNDTPDRGATAHDRAPPTVEPDRDATTAADASSEPESKPE